MQMERGKRPVFLTVLAVLSFISLGFSLLTNFDNITTGPSTNEEMEIVRADIDSQIEDLEAQGMSSWVGTVEKIYRMAEEMNSKFYLAVAVNTIVTLLGIFAVITMIRGFKMGFHLYIVYCLLSIGSIYIYVSPANVPTFVIITNLLFSGLFVLLYSRNLKWMQ
jgi:hypothetical protein